MGCWVRELVFFVVALFESHEDAQVVGPGGYADAGAGEFGAELVKAAGCDAFGGTVDVEGGDWRVVECLLCEEGDFHGVLGDRFAWFGLGVCFG